jgi:histidinol-phosphate aminotransferase
MDKAVAEILNRIRQPFNVNSLAQAAAQAALQDTDFLSQTLSGTHQGIDFLTKKFSQAGFKVLPTQANFLMVDVKTDSRDICEKLLRKGVVVRSLASYGYDTFLRINAGTDQENQMCVDALLSATGK